ncbi:MAG: hypothetical protein EON93_03355 [Burkholderiales bacterium]|jgi:hypothetical protein|nr:MAG: hypothetical protein EON93_03355 [Burkholderiales bacterium]
MSDLSLPQAITRIEALERRLAAHDMAIDILADYIRTDWPRMKFPESFEKAMEKVAVPNARTEDPEAIKLAMRLLVERITTSDLRADQT